MDLNLKDHDFWYSLHGQVPGLLDWDMGNEFFLTCTTDQCSLAEQSLSKYKIQLTKPPDMPQERKSNPDNDGPPTEPNLWMWVNPNIVCPLNKAEAPNRCSKDLPSMPLTKDEEADHLEAQGVVEPLLVSESEQCPQPKQFTFSSDSDLEQEECEEQEDTACQEKDCTKKQTVYLGTSQERESWPRPPLNYSHIVSLALKNNSSSGLNVQQIYNFTRLHFPYFRTAPEGWKNTIRHNLCSLTCFEKVPVTLEDELDGEPRSCLWKLTEEGHRFFQEDTRVLAFTRKESIRQCMLQPELMELLFQL